MSDEGRPLLSVLVAAYNSGATLQQCLDSVISQTYGNVELIVIDGGSSDGSVEVLRANARHIAYCVSEPDRGIYHAWNKALAQARGEWICFLGSDDYLWNEQVLARVVTQLARVPDDINVAYSQVNLVDADAGLLYPIGEPWSQVKQSFKQLMCIPHPSVLHRNRLFQQHGVFDESFRIAGDYELLLRELKSADAFFMPGIIFPPCARAASAARLAIRCRLCARSGRRSARTDSDGRVGSGFWPWSVPTCARYRGRCWVKKEHGLRWIGGDVSGDCPHIGTRHEGAATTRSRQRGDSLFPMRFDDPTRTRVRPAAVQQACGSYFG